jgi:peptidoglycan/xylan/chitin deacetylase (PgdA/CDA1 family)
MPARGRRGRTGGRALAIAGLLLLATLLTAAALRQLARSTTAQLFGRIVARVPTQDSVVALTFDDGPVAAVLGELLDTLGSRGVRATFFVTGAELARSPGAGRALIAAGHELGNHSYSHPRLVLVSSGTVRREVEATDSLLEAAGQRVPIYFRPPYGYKLVGLPLYLARTERTTVTWDVAPDSDGKAAKTADGIVRHVLERVRPGSIILLHPWYASRATTRQALPTLLDSLLGRGYRLTTVGDLLGQAPTPSAHRQAPPAPTSPRHPGDRDSALGHDSVRVGMLAWSQ